MSALPADTTAYVVDYQEQRSRLTTFFRAFTVLPHLFYLYFYSIPVLFVIMYAWFVVVITGRFPERPYNYIERWERYASFVNSYMYLATDRFPPFNGNEGTEYESRFLLGPPKTEYSRVKAFFRIFLVIPVAFVAYAFGVVAQIGAFCAWFVILFTGRIPKGLHDLIVLGMSYQIRVGPFYYLQTEAWPKFTDNDVAQSIAEAGGVAGELAPPPPPPPAPAAASTATPATVGGFAPPTAASPPPPPPPPPPPAPSDDTSEDPPPGGLTGGDPLAG